MRRKKTVRRKTMRRTPKPKTQVGAQKRRARSRRSKASRRRPNKIARGQAGARRKLMALTQTEGFPGKYTAMIVYFLGLKEAWRWVDPQVIEIAVMKNEVFAKTTVDPETGMNIAVLGNVVAIDAALKKIIVKAGLTDTERDWFVGQMNTKTDWVDPQEARRTR